MYLIRHLFINCKIIVTILVSHNVFLLMFHFKAVLYLTKALELQQNFLCRFTNFLLNNVIYVISCVCRMSIFSHTSKQDDVMMT